MGKASSKDHRYALIIAGGSGTRLWPMSRRSLPKQLIPLPDGRSLLQTAAERLRGLVDPSHLYVCASQMHEEVILQALPELPAANFLGEPVGRDTLNAVGLGAAVIASRDAEAAVGVFSADQIILPEDRFREAVDRGFAVAEEEPDALVAFGVRPTWGAPGFGYVRMGAPGPHGSCWVEVYHEKPGAERAAEYAAQPERYAWNAGNFVWRAETILAAMARHCPENHAALVALAERWDAPDRLAVLAEVYPELPKTSIDYAVMEQVGRDPLVRVAAIPLDLSWMDVGSWPMFANTCPRDEHGNALGPGRSLLLDSRNTLVASSDPEHLLAVIGCDDLAVVHTPDATLVCRADRAEAIKEMHALVTERYGDTLL
ncbi:MAG: mannose-1-phosphate guanylyltransferase [Armatimonadetes bacterium]|nr:mannose-1-phosphate guanylyltransferase [Armatimonadota bacterium]